MGQDAIATVARRGYRLVPEVQVETLAQFAAPSEEPGRPRHNLPARSSALIGREQEQADLMQLLARHRLVTVTGPGGIGKTSLALEAARQLAQESDQSILLVELAALADQALVAPTVASALGISLVAARPPLDLLKGELATRRLLLLLDNCEHVVAAAAALVDGIMSAAPGVSVLTTSREPLGVPLEQLYRLTPLTLPESDTVAGITDCAAGALLISRVRTVDHRFQLEPRNAEPIARILRHLDGIPLALEFAAARMPVFGAETIAARLDERFRILSSGSRNALPRHQTLRATLDWSHDLLGEAERIVFRRLGIFAGGCTLEAAEQVVTDDGLTAWQVVEPLAGLVSKSLVVLDTEPTVPRYRLLDTTRAYALEKLDEAGETDSLSRKLTEFLAEQFDRAYLAWQTTPDTEWLAIHGPELDNVRAALDWAFGPAGDAQLGQALAGAAQLLWREQALFSEARQRIGAAIDRIDARTPPAVAARLWLALGDAWAIIDQPRGLAARERAVDVCRSLNEPHLLGHALAFLVASLSKGDRLAEADDAGKEALELLGDGGAPKSLAVALSLLAIPMNRMGRLSEARDFTRRALEIERRVGCDRGTVVSMLNLAELNFTLGAIDEALEGDREVAALLRRTGAYPHILASVLGNLAGHLIMADQIEEADQRGREAMPPLVKLGEIQSISHCLQYTPVLAALQDRMSAAAQLSGYVEAAFQRAGEVPDFGGRQAIDRLKPMLDAAFSPDRLAALKATGAAWDLEHAVRVAFPEIELDPRAPQAARQTPVMSERGE